MKTLILSGVGGSTNWLPLISPLVLIVIIAYSVNFLVKYFRKRRLERENNLINDLNGYFEDVRTHNPGAK